MNLEKIASRRHQLSAFARNAPHGSVSNFPNRAHPVEKMFFEFLALMRHDAAPSHFENGLLPPRQLKEFAIPVEARNVVGFKFISAV